MKTAKSLLTAAALGAAFLVSSNAQGADLKGSYKDMAPTVDTAYGPGLMVRLRGLAVVPDYGSSNWVIDGNQHPDSRLNITNSVVPELDFTYFFTKNLAAELILGVTPHQINAKGDIAATGEIGSVWLLPPTLTFQYHAYLDKGLKPYVGAGVNYTAVFSQKPGPSFRDVNLDNAWGWALQAGVDIPMGGNWFFNVDVKKIFLDTTADVHLNDVNNTHVTADVKVDPWLIGVGVGYRFGGMPQPLK